MSINMVTIPILGILCGINNSTSMNVQSCIGIGISIDMVVLVEHYEQLGLEMNIPAAYLAL